MQTGFAGVEPLPAGSGNALAAMQRVMPEHIDPFTGKGELLEADDKDAFKAIDELWRRQEPLALSRLAQDTHWTAIKGGYQFSSLYKVPDQDVYQQNFPPGQLVRAAVPNKQADLCNKLTETLLVDAAKPDPQPETDDEDAQAGAEMAREFLTQDGGEAGTDDATVFWYAVEGATTKASTFLHVWVDPVGGGSVPKQIKAHPKATDPAFPLDAIDEATGQPIPTVDYALRYVTAGDEENPPQFTVNPSEAERVWLPKLRVDKMDRRHVRLYPETAGIHDARKAIIAWYCTVGEARLRWPETVGQMEDAQIAQLCEWQPPRAMAMLPPVLRARWKQSASKDAKGQVNDERLLFYYGFYHLATPDYPEGAFLFLSGAQGGIGFGKGPLSATVEMPDGVTQDARVTDTKCLDIPIVQVMLVQDPDDGDPTGKAVIARIGGAGEAGATIVTSLLEQIDKILHPARFATATSPLTDDDIESSRAGDRLATIMSREDAPVYEDAPDLPANTLDVVDWNYAQMDSAIGLNKPAQGSDDSQEVSGVARRIAVNQALVSVSRMQHGVNVAWERYWRIKLQLAMAHFSVPQLLRYVGVDGAAKQEWFTGNNFARVGQITVASGTGTLMPPGEKVNYVLQLQEVGYLDPDEAHDIARPAFAKQLGVPENPHVQRIERQVSSWLEGPPEGWEAQQAQFVQAVQLHSQMAQAAIQQSPDPRAAQIPPPPTPPWTPFAVEPMDTEPPIAAIRKRRLSHLMAKVEFSDQPEPWKQVVRDAYTQAAQSVQAAAMQAQQTQAVQNIDSSAGETPQGVAA
jgi:hypothetical protein